MADTLVHVSTPVPAPREAPHDEAARPATAGFIDADCHGYPASMSVLYPYMAARWRAFVQDTGYEGPMANPYPKVYANAARRDAYPPGGGKPGTDERFAARQLLDTWGLSYAVINPLYAHSLVRNLHLGSELMRAVNRWLAAEWLDADPRWRGSIVVNIEDPEAAAEEIRTVARWCVLPNRTGGSGSGPSSAPRPRRGCRWASISAAAAPRSPAWGGLPTTSRTTPAWRRRSSRR